MLLLLPLAGCRPVGSAFASLQYHNIEFRLAKAYMVITINDGGTDMAPLMRKEHYVGQVTSGRVTVCYPEGLEVRAEEIAEEFDAFYPTIQRETGISWSFDLILKLVRVSPGSTGFRYAVKLPKNRRIEFPVPIVRDRPATFWPPVVAHEMTEASLIAPVKRSQLVMDDMYSGDYCVSFGTRWFRDGVADYAKTLFASPTALPPANVYADLNRARTDILKWANCPGQPNLYGASQGLIVEMMNRWGKDAVRQFVCDLRREPYPDGRALRRTFKRVTGCDLVAFLQNYQTPWTGFAVSDTPGAGVRVCTVYAASPASRRGVRVGDIVTCFAGQPVFSANQLGNLVARQKVGAMTPLIIERDGQAIPIKLKLIALREQVTGNSE